MVWLQGTPCRRNQESIYPPIHHTSGSLNDGKAAIPLLKSLQRLPLSVRYGIMDAGYDSVPIYQQIYHMEAHSILAYNKRNEGETLGFDPRFAPTCVREYSYRYDSYDPKYKTLKFVCPKECKDCPLARDSLCQKIYKTRIYDGTQLLLVEQKSGRNSMINVRQSNVLSPI